MVISEKYWKICSLDCNGKGFRLREINAAKGYCQQIINNSDDYLQGNLSRCSDNSIVENLLDVFCHFKADSLEASAVAGLCLRCYVSYPILSACKKIAGKFGHNRFSYRDLISLVLDDDGAEQIVLGPNPLQADKTEQLKLNSQGEVALATYRYFSVNVLQTYNGTSERRLSLQNWAFLLTQQHQDIKHYLSEYGFRIHSDWSLINQVRDSHLENFTKRARKIIKIFHSVYRRDRLAQNYTSRCLPPTKKQLLEMQHLLGKEEIVLASPCQLLEELQEIAKQLQGFDFWRRHKTPQTEPLEIVNEEGEYEIRKDLPVLDENENIDIDIEKFSIRLHEKLADILEQSIWKYLRKRLYNLKKSLRYSTCANKFIPALKLYYFQNVSQKEIAKQLGFKNQTQVSRILEPTKILLGVRQFTVQSVLQWLIEMTENQVSITPSYLDQLTLAIESFIDQEIFEAAEAEIQAGKNRNLHSQYAQALQRILEKIEEEKP